jgi:hypothetical protein
LLAQFHAPDLTYHFHGDHLLVLRLKFSAEQLNTLVNFESALLRLHGQFSVGVNKPCLKVVPCMNGGLGRNRTIDTRIFNVSVSSRTYILWALKAVFIFRVLKRVIERVSLLYVKPHFLHLALYELINVELVHVMS